jgi:hypothetical protein
MAQNPPAAAAPGAQVQPPSAAPDGQVKFASCDGAGGAASSTASIVQATGDSLQRKRWQPRGGVIQFVVRGFPAIPEKASFHVCFRWKATTPDNKTAYVQVRPDRLDRNNDTWTVTTTIPRDFRTLADGMHQAKALPLVPLADVRIVAFADKTLAADVVTTIGITYPWAAIVFALATVAIALIVLWFITKKRLTQPGIQAASWPLRIIATPNGNASLSQLQVVLWTLVVAASAVYVMSLSGDLIQITDGTLVLLGIAGAAAIGAKVHNASQDTTAQTAAVTAQKDADKAGIDAANTAALPGVTPAQIAIANREAADKATKAQSAQQRANDVVNPPATQQPRWSDLIVAESTRADGTVSREIDVARFQMLLFTLITAVFVLMNVLTTYVIPEIPTGFLTLMGISNGVYLGAKVAQGSG